MNTRRHQGIMKYWQWNFGKRESEELYNIKKDPYCMYNLASGEQYAGLKSKLAKEMSEILIGQADPRILGQRDIFDQYDYAGAVKDFYNRYKLVEKIPTPWVNDTDFEPESVEMDSLIKN